MVCLVTQTSLFSVNHSINDPSINSTCFRNNWDLQKGNGIDIWENPIVHKNLYFSVFHFAHQHLFIPRVYYNSCCNNFFHLKKVHWMAPSLAKMR